MEPRSPPRKVLRVFQLGLNRGGFRDHIFPGMGTRKEVPPIASATSTKVGRNR